MTSSEHWWECAALAGGTCTTPEDCAEQAKAERVLAAPTRAEVEQLTTENDAALAQLAAQGIKVDQGSLSTIRLNMLTEHLLGDLDDPRRLEFEAGLQRKYAELIAGVRSQAMQARLLHGVQLGGNGAGRG